MAGLIPSPDLDIRNEEMLAAEAIGRTSGALDGARILSQIEYLRQLYVRVTAGEEAPPICPELTNANPSSPHTVLLEVMGWLLAQIARRINQLPVRDQIEFHRLFGVELHDATAATTTLKFTLVPLIGLYDVQIPEGTLVSTIDGEVTFETLEELSIASPDMTSTVAARRTVAGATLLSPDTLTVMADPVAFVASVTNPDIVDAGSEAETVAEALSRAVNYQRRGERLVTARDVEDAVREEILNGNGIARAFEFVKAGDFTVQRAGYVTLVVMTAAGNPVSDETKQAISVLLKQSIGSIFYSLLDPQYIDFNVVANVRVSGLTPQTAIRAAAERNLRTFYAATSGNFGRSILRSDIIALVESTEGIERIVSDAEGPILSSPVEDITLAPYEIPRLLLVALNVVT